MFTYYFPIHPFRLVPMFSGITPYVSEQKKKVLDVYGLFVRELRSRLNVCNDIYSNVLFNQIQKCIEK